MQCSSVNGRCRVSQDDLHLSVPTVSVSSNVAKSQLRVFADAWRRRVGLIFEDQDVQAEEGHAS